jgi:hypothetical protein
MGQKKVANLGEHSYSVPQKNPIFPLQVILQPVPVNWKDGISGLASTGGIERKSHFPDL